MSKGPTSFIMRFRISIPAEAGISCSHPSHCHSREGGNLLSLTPINTVIPAKAGTSKITFFRRQETSHASPKQILMQIGNLLSLTPINTVIPAKAGTSKITFSACRKPPMHLQSKFSCKLGTSSISQKQF
jgi:hypothetical protein